MARRFVPYEPHQSLLFPPSLDDRLPQDARFRWENIRAFESVFLEVVRIAASVGLVKLGTIAIDGTKQWANASKHKTMRYGRMKVKERRLAREVRELTRRAREEDMAEDEEYGDGDEDGGLPGELRRREERLAPVRPDQVGALIPLVPAPWSGEGAGRVAPGLPGDEPAAALEPRGVDMEEGRTGNPSFTPDRA